MIRRGEALLGPSLKKAEWGRVMGRRPRGGEGETQTQRETVVGGDGGSPPAGPAGFE